MNRTSYHRHAEAPASDHIEIESLVIWTALILGSIISLRIPLPGGQREINIAMFDLAVIAAFAYVLVRRRVAIEQLPFRLFVWLGLASLAVVAHAAFTHRYGAWTPIPRLDVPIQRSGLLRETVKLASIPIEVIMLMTIFSVPRYRKPAALLLIALAGVISAYIIFERIQFLLDNVPYFANLAAHSLMGTTVLAISLLEGPPIRRYFLSLAWVFAASIVMIIGIRKTYLLTSLTLAAVFAAALVHESVRTRDFAALKRLGIFVGCTVVALVLIHIVMTFEFYIGRDPVSVLSATVSRSIDVRFDLQIVAWHLALLSFPTGIGPGQFGALAPLIPEIADLNVQYIHNTPLSFVTELGALGVLLCAGFFYLIFLACRTGNWPSRLARLSFFVVPMIFNDTHGLRMTILLLSCFAIRATDSRAHAA